MPQGAEVFLFGSRARGDGHEESDWDLLVLLDKKGRATLDDIDNYAYPLRELGWDYDADINAIVFTKEQWAEQSFTPFYKNVEEDGIRL